MNGQERILRERFAQVACQSCGAEHLPDDVLVLAQRGSRWLVLLTCHRCKRRGIFVASFPHPASRAERLRALEDTLEGGEPEGDEDDYLLTILRNWSARTPNRTQPSGSSLPSPTSPPPSATTSAAHADTPVSAADVTSIRQFLDGFNGDFRALFGADGSGSR